MIILDVGYHARCVTDTERSVVRRAPETGRHRSCSEADHCGSDGQAVRAFGPTSAPAPTSWGGHRPEAAELADRYTDLGIGLTDASLVVLAARVGSADVATFDERHFRAVRPLGVADAFRLLPLDTSG